MPNTNGTPNEAEALADEVVLAVDEVGAKVARISSLLKLALRLAEETLPRHTKRCPTYKQPTTWGDKNCNCIMQELRDQIESWKQ